MLELLIDNAFNSGKLKSQIKIADRSEWGLIKLIYGVYKLSIWLY